MYNLGDTISFTDPYNKPNVYTGTISVICTHKVTGIAVYAVDVPGLNKNNLGISQIEQQDLVIWNQDIYNDYLWVLNVIGKDLFCWVAEKDIVYSVQVTINFPTDYIIIDCEIKSSSDEDDEDRGGLKYL